MSLDRRALLSLCIASALLAAGSAAIMLWRWNEAVKAAPPARPALPEPVDTGTGWPTSSIPSPAPAPAPAPAPPPPPAAGPRKRNVLFSYRSSRPQKVDLVGSFNDWSPAPMAKGENHTWSITLSLDPGEYTYNFLVDGRPVRDPNNPRTAPEGRSLLVLKP